MSPLRSLFIALSRNARLRTLSEHSALARRLSRRFVAGHSLDDALAVARSLNQQGISVTLDSLGENTATEAQATRAAAAYTAALTAIAAQRLDANVSLKLSQMGMDVSPALAERIVASLAERIVASLAEQATSLNGFLRVDMEGSPYTTATLDLVRRIHARPQSANIGVVLQSYLRRTPDDLRTLLAEGIRIRLCKGAYLEPPSIAFAAKSDVDAAYLALAQTLLTSGVFHGLATHDDRLIERIIAFAAANNIPPSAYEFQMLYGIRRDLQLSLVSRGFRVRVYVPFGRHWYPYFMRRLAERPANLLFLLRNLLR